MDIDTFTLRQISFLRFLHGSFRAPWYICPILIICKRMRSMYYDCIVLLCWFCRARYTIERRLMPIYNIFNTITYDSVLGKNISINFLATKTKFISMIYERSDCLRNNCKKYWCEIFRIFDTNNIMKSSQFQSKWYLCS